MSHPLVSDPLDTWNLSGCVDDDDDDNYDDEMMVVVRGVWGLCHLRVLLNRASALVTTCP